MNRRGDDFDNTTGKIDPANFKVNISDSYDDYNNYDEANGNFGDFGSNERDYYTDRLRNSATQNDLYQNDKLQKNEKKEHKKRDKIKSHKNRRIFRIMWLVMVVLVGLTFASYLIGGSNDFFAIDRVDASASVQIPKDVTPEELAEILSTAGVINQPDFFEIYCKMTADMEYFVPGTYEVKTNMDYEAIINYLQAGESNMEVVSVTFQEGMTLTQIAAKLEENRVAKADDILAAAQTSDFDNYDMIESISNSSQKVYKLEGYLFPDTYEFYVGEDINSVVGKLLNNFQNRMTKNIVEKISESNYTLDEYIIIASIIQAEAANVDDMYNVSSVIHNRLESGEYYDIFHLGMDSTIYYPYAGSEDAPAGFNTTTNPYNTYEITGLPPGAICSPGLDAIKAAVSPNNTDYFYFCHSTDGTAYYAETEEGHLYNLGLAGLLDE